MLVYVQRDLVNGLRAMSLIGLFVDGLSGFVVVWM